jgi:hypothetical protein
MNSTARDHRQQHAESGEDRTRLEDDDHAPLTGMGRARFERPPGFRRLGLVQLHSTGFYPVTRGSIGRAILGVRAWRRLLRRLRLTLVACAARVR